MPRLRALAPWLLALLALAWALAPHVSKDSLLLIAPYLAALVLLLALLALAIHLRRRPRRPAPPPNRPIIRAIRKTRPTATWLCIGLPGHGKTTLLTSAGPHRHLAQNLHLLPTRELLLEHPTDFPQAYGPRKTALPEGSRPAP